MTSQQQQKVIEQLYNSPELNKVISRIEPKHAREDVKHRLFLTLLNMRIDKFKKICSSQAGGIERYAFRAISNLELRGQENAIREKVRLKKYTHHHQQQMEFSELCNDHQSLAVKFLKELPEYNQKIMELYIENEYSSIKVGEAVGISPRSVRHNLSLTRQYIVEKIKKHGK